MSCRDLHHGNHHFGPDLVCMNSGCKATWTGHQRNAETCASLNPLRYTYGKRFLSVSAQNAERIAAAKRVFDGAV